MISNGKTCQSMKVLVIAYACEPGRGSELGTGWHMSLGLAKKVDLTVVTRANNKEKIEADLDGRLGPKPKFVYVDPASWAIRLKRSGILPVQIFYQFWQVAVAKAVKNLECHFDIIHQMTFNSFEVPPLSFWVLKGAKVWGPVGGGQRVPWKLLAGFGFKAGAVEFIRNIRVFCSSWNPLCRGAIKRSDLLLFANNETRDLLGVSHDATTDLMIDVGVDLEKFSEGSGSESSSGMIFLFAGRLEGRKGVLLLVRAFKKHALCYEHTELRIVGNGPLAERVKREVEGMQCASRISLVGLVSHTEIAEEFDRADVFLFPSLRDTSGTAVLEAMSMGLPVICFDHQGAAVMVSDECGFKVGVESMKQSICDLAGAMNAMADSTLEDRLAMGRAGRRRVAGEFDWESKVRKISGYYEKALSTK